MTTGVSSADVAKRVAAKVTHSLWGDDPDPESPILEDYRADPVCGHFFRASAPPTATTRLRSELVRNRRREARLAPLTTKKAFGTVARVVRRSLDSFQLEPPAELALDRPHADPNDSFVGTVTATAAALGRRAPAIEPADPELLRKLVDSGDMAHVIFRESCEGEGARASLTWWNSRAETRRAERVQGRGLATFLAAARGPHDELDPTGAQVREQFHGTVDVRSWLAASASTEAFHDRSRLDPLDTTVGPDARVLKGRQTPSLEYVRNPRFRSRTELLAHRRSLLKPAPKSYDLDGDGVVTETEAFFAAFADRDGNYSLDDEERKRVLELMRGGAARPAASERSTDPIVAPPASDRVAALSRPAAASPALPALSPVRTSPRSSAPQTLPIVRSPIRPRATPAHLASSTHTLSSGPRVGTVLEPFTVKLL